VSRRPDFLFVGHPRSGSGLLDSYLSGHPDIFMAKKELHYFGADLRYHDPPRTLENYLSFFRGAKAAHRRVGEASTWSLISERAAGELRAFSGDLRVVMLLRNPTSWLHSLHSHLVFSGDEDIASFEEALAAEPDRLAGRRLPPSSIPACALHYMKNTDYAAQVGRYFDALGRDRVHVILLDDLQKDPREQYRRLLQFLGVRTEFPGMDAVMDASERSRNSNRGVRVGALRDWMIRPGPRRVLEGVDAAPFPGARLGLRVLRRVNLRFEDRPPMAAETKARLTAELRPRVEALEALLDRPLPAWKAAR
jgi:hypothetical protein